MLTLNKHFPAGYWNRWVLGTIFKVCRSSIKGIVNALLPGVHQNVIFKTAGLSK